MNGLALTALLPCVGGLVLGGFGLALFFLGKRSRHGGTALIWPSVPGVVKSSSVREHIFFDKRTHEPHSTFEPLVEYAYSLAGKERERSQVSFGRSNLTQAQAEAIVARYPRGTPVAVHFSPENPSQEVIRPNEGEKSLLSVAGVAFVTLGFLSVALGAVLYLLPSAFN